MVVSDFGGQLPNTVDDLMKLPGVGRNTAGAIVAYAFNQPVVFVETNIRTVLFHHVFDGRNDVTDRELLDVAEQLLDRENPREWYWALMDYGSFLKSTAGGRNEVSKHYKKQSPLAGSPREMRGRILKNLVAGALTVEQLREATDADERFDPALADLTQEGFVQKRGKIYCLTGYVLPS
jgi:A/G-specific adenine glycosylase